MNGNIFSRISTLEEKVSEAEENNLSREEISVLKMELEEPVLEKISICLGKNLELIG